MSSEPEKIRIQIDGVDYSIPKGHSLYALEKETGMPVVFGCYSGRCGICCVRVLGGEENLNPLNEMEKVLLTADEQEDLRLGCQCEVKGPASFSSKPSKIPLLK
jgi:ferredoxin